MFWMGMLIGTGCVRNIRVCGEIYRSNENSVSCMTPALGAEHNIPEERAISSSDLKNLRHFSRLTELELWTSQVGDLSFLRRLSNLVSLDLDISSSRVTDLSALKKLQKLRHLKLNLSYTSIEDLSVLSQLPKLKTLSLYLTQSSVQELQFLKALYSLEVFEFGGAQNIPNINMLKALKELILELPQDYSGDLAFLAEMKQLEILDLELEEGRTWKIPHLGALTQLSAFDINSDSDASSFYVDAKGLGLQNLDFIHDSKVFSALELDLSQSEIVDISVIRSLEGVSELSLYAPRDYALDLSPIGARVELRDLYMHLSHSKSTDLSCITFLNQLESLTLVLSESSVLSIAPLKTQKQLRSLRLYLDKSNVTDASPLLDLTQLRELDISFNRATVHIIPFLAELKTLRSLRIKLPEGDKGRDMLEQFQKSRPAVDVSINAY